MWHVEIWTIVRALSIITKDLTSQHVSINLLFVQTMRYYRMTMLSLWTLKVGGNFLYYLFK